MNLLHLNIAAVDIGRPEALRSWPLMGSKEGMWFVASMLAVALMFFIWAIFIRKSPRGPTYKYPHRPPGAEPPAQAIERRARRRKRRKERRNPTLAETGGLPPIRSSGPGLPPTPH